MERETVGHLNLNTRTMLFQMPPRRRPQTKQEAPERSPSANSSPLAGGSIWAGTSGEQRAASELGGPMIAVAAGQPERTTIIISTAEGGPPGGTAQEGMQSTGHSHKTLAGGSAQEPGGELAPRAQSQTSPPSATEPASVAPSNPNGHRRGTIIASAKTSGFGHFGGAPNNGLRARQQHHQQQQAAPPTHRSAHSSSLQYRSASSGAPPTSWCSLGAGPGLQLVRGPLLSPNSIHLAPLILLLLGLLASLTSGAPPQLAAPQRDQTAASSSTRHWTATNKFPAVRLASPAQS